MKTIAILMATLLIFSAMPLIAAEADVNVSDNGETTTAEATVSAGITPDSPLYGLERAMERISLSLTFNKAKKASKALGYAEERLAEVEEMAEEDNVEAAQEAQEDHDALINETEELVDELETNGDEETAENALGDVVELKFRIEAHSEKVARIKNRILERKIASGNWSEEKIAQMRGVFDKIIAKSQEMDAKMEQKRENIRTKLKVLSELTDEELEALEGQIGEKARERIEVRNEERVKAKGSDDSDDDSVDDSDNGSMDDDSSSNQTESDDLGNQQGQGQTGRQ